MRRFRLRCDNARRQKNISVPTAHLEFHQAPRVVPSLLCQARADTRHRVPCVIRLRIDFPRHVKSDARTRAHSESFAKIWIVF
jgi:hypothetical protein